MLTEKQKEYFLKMFTDVEDSYEENLKKLDKVLINWEDEQALKHSSDIPMNLPLEDKIRQLRKAKEDWSKYIETGLKPKLNEPYMEFAPTKEALEKELAYERVIHNTLIMMPNE